MSEFLLLFAVLAVIYLLDCVCSVPLTCFPIAFTGRKWRLATTVAVLGGSKRRLILGPLLPGAGVAVCSDAPVSWDGNALCATTKPHGSGHKHLSINNPVSAEGVELVIARELIAACASPQTAKLLAQLVRDLSQAPIQDRQSMVREQWRAQFDVRTIRRRLRIFRTVQPHLAIDGLVVFLLIFAIAPLALLVFGTLALVVAAVLVLLMVVDIMHLYWRCYRTVWSSDSLPWRHLLVMALTPPAVMRAADYLLRELFSEFHWIAVMTVAGENNEKEKLIARYVRQLEFPAPWEQVECRVGREARAMWRSTVLDFVRDQGMNVGDLIREPNRESDEVNAFCPRCMAQFVKAAKCSDCGIELKAFNQAG